MAPVGTPASGDKMLAFKYDYMGRRVEKTYAVHNGSAWVTESVQRFVYDEWNVVMVLDDNNSTLRKCTWGLDVSRTIHGAGGIGGLLAVEETATANSPSYWFFYDANGNVGQVLKASDQTIAAKYEYDPYGNVIASGGTYADDNPIRFSTKWFDTELAGAQVGGAVGTSGLGYWGYRYYSPRLGRWVGRDTVHEPGAVFLRTRRQPTSVIPRDRAARLAEQDGYHFVLNHPTGHVDSLGLVCSITVHRAEKQKTDDGTINVGHQWIETETTSYGFWPTGSVWRSEGVVKTPDSEYEGDRSGPMWETGQSSWGPWGSMIFRRPGRLKYGYSKGVCCADATCPMIEDCLRGFAAKTNRDKHIYTLTNYNCRWWVSEALELCCLYKKRS